MMSRNQEHWQTYEEVAQYLLDEFATHFGLGHVEGKQIVPGESGTEWEIDAKGVEVNGEGFLIVECRRHTKSKVNQEQVAGLAYRIRDTKASGGIVVSPLDLQSGAKKVAAHSGIQHVKLDPRSTTTDYVMTFLGKVFVGLTDTVVLKDECSVVLEKNGKTIRESHLH